MKAALAAVVLAVAGCATNVPQGAGTSAARNPASSLERIAMRTSSFWHSATTGSPFHSEWQIDRSGEGTFRSFEVMRDENDVLRQSDVTRRFSAGRVGFRRIEALLRPAEPFAGSKIPCNGVPLTDSTRGTITWTRGETTRGLKFDQGCQAKSALRIFRRMDEAEALATKWGANGPVVRSEAMPDPADPDRPN